MPGIIGVLDEGSGGVHAGTHAGPRPELLAGLVLAAVVALTLPLVSSGRTFAPAVNKDEASFAYGKLPLSFIPNRGQTDPRVSYYAKGSGYSFYFTPDKAVIALTKGKRGHVLELRFLGANPNPKLEATRRASGTVNYFKGHEHHTGLPTYRKITYRDLWPGIDMTFRGRGGNLEYEFLVQPGANPHAIRLAYRGTEGLSITRAGDLVLQTPFGSLSDKRPRSFQRIGARRVSVQSGYALTGTGYRFELGTYDRHRPLVIDPGLTYSTYLGGGSDGANSIAVDAQGNAYVAGETGSSAFPTTPGAYDTTFNGGSRDVFVTKLNAAGTAPVYSTYLGGSGSEVPLIAIDGNGSAYLTGETESADFPTTPGAFDTTFAGGGTRANDVFVTKLHPSGGTLVYSTFLGGSDSDFVGDIKVDALGHAYVAGGTSSADYPTTAGAYDTTYNGGDAFVTKLNETGSGLVYSTFLGGSDSDSAGAFGGGIALDRSSNAYVTGTTFSTDFPATAGAYDATLDGRTDVFVAKLNPAGSGLLYATLIGGSLDEFSSGAAVDGQGNAYITGETNFGVRPYPTTPGAYKTSFSGGGGDEVFVTKFNADASGLVYSTYIGGQERDIPWDIVVDRTGRATIAGEGSAYACGSSLCSDYPTTPGAYDTSYNGGSLDAFVTRLNGDGSALSYSTFVGGNQSDAAFGIAMDGQDNVYTAGVTNSGDFPTTPGAYDRTFGGFSKAFVTKLALGPGPPATLTLSPKTATNTVDSEHCVTATVKDASGTPTPDITVVFSVTPTNRTGGTRTTDPRGQATFCYTGELLGEDQITAFADFDPKDRTPEPGEPSDTATKQWVIGAGELCRGSVTNNGQIRAQNGDRASFRGQASASAAGVRGSERYLDRGPAQPVTVSSSELQAITCPPDGRQASIFGRAAIDGSGSFAFRINVFDGGEPGRRSDSYRILLQTGYDSGVQTLRAGNVRMRLR